MSADAPPLGSSDTVAPFPTLRGGLAAVDSAPPPLWSGGAIETVGLLKAALPAHRALAACAQALSRTPLDAGALEAFALLDAVGAVQLDGEVVDPRTVLELPAHQMDAAVARQVEALARVTAADASVDAGCALELAATIAGRTVAVRRGAPDPDEAGLGASHAARRVPPLPRGVERLQVRLERWQAFVQRDSGDLDPLLMCGTALAEWLAIRPFTGANVRVGQLLAQLLLVEEDLLPVPALPFSLHVSRHADGCWQALQATRAAAHPEPWLRFFLGAVEASAADTLERLERWEEVLAVLPVTLEALLPKTPSAALVQLCARPSFGLADAIDTGLARRQTAAAWLARLVEGGVLREARAGKEKRFVNDAVVAALLD